MRSKNNNKKNWQHGNTKIYNPFGGVSISLEELDPRLAAAKFMFAPILILTTSVMKPSYQI